MSGNKITIGCFVFPIILFFAAVVYTIFINRYGFSVLLSMPGISAVICSVIAIIFIKKYELNINRCFIIFLINIIVGTIITIVGVLLFSPLAIPIIMPIVILVEAIILNKKAEYIEGKITLIIINPVLHLQVFLFAMQMTNFEPLSGFRDG